jgi:ribosome-binding ATPase YchF (GTP1/OBG family)
MKTSRYLPEDRAILIANRNYNDLERGFIRAEVVGYEEFIACGGSYAGASAAGKLRLEGKEYVVQDGEIINVRFNVYGRHHE